jgi:hypothetical protein
VSALELLILYLDPLEIYLHPLFFGSHPRGKGLLEAVRVDQIKLVTGTSDLLEIKGIARNGTGVKRR